MYDDHHGGHHQPEHYPTEVIVQQLPTMGFMAMDQPMPQTVIVMLPGPWHHSLCSCLDEIPSCLRSWLCPCIQYGKNYEAIHRDGCLCQAIVFACLMPCRLQCLVHMGFRGHLRSKFAILGGDMEDCLLTWCCSCCALSQEAREINYRKHEAASREIHF